MQQLEEEEVGTEQVDQAKLEPAVAVMNTLAEVDHQLEKLESWYENWKRLKTRKETDLARGQQKYAGLLHELQRSEGEKLKLETTLRDEVNYREQTSVRIDRVRCKLDALVEDEECLSEIIQQYDNGKDAADKNHIVRQDKYKRLLASYEAAKEDLVLVEADCKNKLQVKKEGLSTMAVVEAELKIELETRKKFIAQLNLDLNGLQKKQQTVEINLLEKETELAHMKETVSELEKQRNSFDSELTLAGNEKENTLKTVQRVQETLEQRRAERDRQLDNIADKESDLLNSRSEQERLLLEKRKMVADQEVVIAALQDRLNALETDKMSALGREEQLQKEYGERISLISGLEATLLATDKDNELLREKMSTAREQLDAVDLDRGSHEKTCHEKKKAIAETISKEKSLVENARNDKEFLTKMCSKKRDDIRALQMRIRDQKAAEELEEKRLSQQDIQVTLSPPPTQRSEQPQSQPGQPTFLQPRIPAKEKAAPKAKTAALVRPVKRALSLDSNESEYVDLPTSVIMSEDSVRGDDSPKRAREAGNTQEAYSDRATAASSAPKTLATKRMAPLARNAQTRGRRGGLNRGIRHGRLDFL